MHNPPETPHAGPVMRAVVGSAHLVRRYARRSSRSPTLLDPEIGNEFGIVAAVDAALATLASSSDRPRLT